MSDNSDASQYNLSGNLQLEVGADEFDENGMLSQPNYETNQYRSLP